MPPHNDAPSPTGSFDIPTGPVRPMSYDHSYYQQYSSSESLSMSSRRPLQAGIYVPTVCFFKDNEDLDLETIASHAVRLARAGIKGLTTQGSNGESVMLSRREKQLVTHTTRQALDDAGFTDMPIIAGCGAQSTREVIELCEEAYSAGADYALVLPPSYYGSLHNKDTVKSFFTDIADASPVGIFIYNFPPAAGGIDLNSDVIVELSKHPNIVGCKLTCGNTGKLNRIAAQTRPITASNTNGFFVGGGSCDFTTQTAIGGGSGIIGGFANIAPKASVKLWRLMEEGKYAEAQKLQAKVAAGDWAAIQGGLISVKCGLQSHFGYGGYARRPLPRPGKDEVKRWREAFEEIVTLEKSL